jgi:SAM-dependent methyltransferase
MTHPPGQWQQLIARDPGHSARYIERFKLLAAQGQDLYGEARLIDTMVGRGAAILDAGCGPGRHAGYLHAAGHRVVGVDVDPVLIAAARADAPGPDYLVGDLAGFELPPELPQRFDAILCAGNVMTFLHPGARLPALGGMAARLTPDGRAVIGFGAGRGYDFDQFLSDAVSAGLSLEQRFSTWDLRRFTAGDQFQVAVLARAHG